MSSLSARASTLKEDTLPTYEKYDGDGNMVERSVTFLGTPHDFQLSTVSSMTDSPWRRVAGVDDAQVPMPVFVEPPSEQDTETDGPVPTIDQPPVDDGELYDDEPAESGDHTEE